ncbi:dicarboxylate/amino acid:cation symporter [Natronoglycomyces albus]|uniref:Dicarboxylate/amino acid:cation symporter n=1 Tax=Natronoglycomyces albus TaxID=2811108 RepID=A0A895XS51_9ACTN|nr:dicarboxylate/amino acid:cation symporter [Natronoglycomyces albus]QSB05386.1 dicarboxylate/amino acid:cation symporter [Natronoglycomyces albus]
MVKAITKIPFSAQLLIGLAVGILAGLAARFFELGWLTTTLAETGSMFVQLLFLIVPPLVFTAIVVSIASLRNVANAGRLVTKTLGWFLATSLIAVSVGITIGLVTNPGSGVNLSTADTEAPDRVGGWTDFLSGIVPTNVVESFLEVNVLQIVFLAIAIGIAAVKIGPAAEAFLNFNKSLLNLTQKALWWVIRLAPIGTAGLIGNAVASYGWDLLEPLAVFSAGIYAGSLLLIVAVYPLLLRLFAGVSPWVFLRKTWPALQFAFASRSSIGTMPLAQRTIVNRLGVPREYASFASPFGATTKMDGCAAIYPAIAAIFIAQVYGIELGIQDYLLIAFVSVIGSAATAGLTGAIVMLTLTLTTLGLPLEGVALLLAIDPIMDMIRTTANVAGQMAVPVLVAKSEKVLDVEVYHAPNQPLDAEADPFAESAQGSQPQGIDDALVIGDSDGTDVPRQGNAAEATSGHSR